MKIKIRGLLVAGIFIIIIIILQSSTTQAGLLDWLGDLFDGDKLQAELIYQDYFAEYYNYTNDRGVEEIKGFFSPTPKVYEDNHNLDPTDDWKKYTEARSLKDKPYYENYWIVKDDGVTDVSIVDYNATSVQLGKIVVLSPLSLSNSIPIWIEYKDKTTETLLVLSKTDVSKTALGSIDLTDAILHIGETSTTIYSETNGYDDGEYFFDPIGDAGEKYSPSS